MNKIEYEYRDMQNHPYVKYLKRIIDRKDDAIIRHKKKLQAMKTEIIKMRREILAQTNELEETIKNIMYVRDIFDRIKEEL